MHTHGPRPCFFFRKNTSRETETDTEEVRQKDTRRQKLKAHKQVKSVQDVMSEIW